MHNHDIAEDAVSHGHGRDSTRLDARTLIDLADDRGGTRLSLYLPLPVGGDRGPKTRIRAKNLLSNAERALQAEGLPAVDVTELVGPAGQLVEKEVASDQTAGGLAVFAGPGRVRSVRVPMAVPQLVVVGQGYAVGPLLPSLNADDRFYTLTLNHDEIALYRGNRFRLEPMALEGLEIATWLTMPPARPAQVHAFVAGRGGSTTQPIFHGTGEDDRKALVLRHLRGLDRALLEALDDKEVPLVLAGVRSLQTLYRLVSRHPNLLPDGIDGNPRDLRSDALHRQAWGVAESAVNRAEASAIRRYAELRGTPRTIDGLDAVLAAASQGRVDTLLVASGNHNGRGAPTGAPVVRRESPSGLPERLATAAIETLRHRGTVFAVPPNRLPGGPRPAALVRY